MTQQPVLHKQLRDWKEVHNVLQDLQNFFAPCRSYIFTLGRLGASAPPAQRQRAESAVSAHQPRDFYSRYEFGLRELLDRMELQHPRYREALVYEQQLVENVSQSRQFGDTDTHRAERSRIIGQLNELSVAELNMAFNQLCGPPVVPTVTQESPESSKLLFEVENNWRACKGTLLKLQGSVTSIKELLEKIHITEETREPEFRSGPGGFSTPWSIAAQIDRALQESNVEVLRDRLSAFGDLVDTLLYLADKALRDVINGVR